MAVEGNGLLAHLTLGGWFTDRVEEIATQSLAYILSRSAPGRNALQQLLLNGGADVGPIKRVKPEAAGDDGARPDLACYDDQGVERVLIENKFGAELTERQPNTYLSRLPKDDRPCALLFVAPEARIPTLWPVLRELAGVSNAPDADAGASIKSVVAIHDKTYMMLTSWRHLLNEMADSGETALLGDIHQLQVLCERMDEDTPPPIGDDELGPEIQSLQRLIDDATDLARGKGYLNTNGLNRTPRTHGYGRYAQIGSHDEPGDGVAWIGINAKLWDEYMESPIWVMFVSNYGRTDLGRVRRRLAPLKLDDYEQRERDWPGPNVPIYLPTGVEYHVTLDAVVERLGEIAGLVSDTA